MGFFKKKQEIQPKTSWVAPVQRHVDDATGAVKWITIRIRLYSGNVEQDFNFKFVPGIVTAEQLVTAVSDRLEIGINSRRLFALWIVGRDLELQLRDEIDVFEIIKNWHTLMSNYTHIPEAINAGSPVNRYILIFRRVTLIDTQIEEQALKEEIVVKLLYGEMRNHLLSEKLLPAITDIVTLGGLELQVISDYKPESYPQILGNSKWFGLVPKSSQLKMTPDEWIAAFQSEHAKHVGKDAAVIRSEYVAYTRKLPLYGCAFFPCSREIPPAGLFECRIENHTVAINNTHIFIIDRSLRTILMKMTIDLLSWTYSKHQIEFICKSTNSKQKWSIVTPQSFIIMNILSKATRALFKQGKYDEEQSMKKKVVKQAERSSDGFFLGQVHAAQQRNSMLAANRISLAHQKAILSIYGDKNINMVANVVVPDIGE